MASIDIAAAAASRRRFLKTATAATATATAWSTLGSAWAGSPNDRLQVACVGLGGMGCKHLEWLSLRPDVRVIALCDVDQSHLALAAEIAPGAEKGKDFRELLTREDIDAVFVATPDHWHALIASSAARHGKHVYCEKPLANSIGEGRAIVDAVEASGVVLQTGCHERSNTGAKVAKRIVDEGRLGDIHTVRIRLPNSEKHLQEVEHFRNPPADSAPPEGLDHDFWLGHTPVSPYNERRCHFWWRFHERYGGGEMTDRGAHVIDLAHSVLGLDNTGPVRVSAQGSRPAGGFFDAFINFVFDNRYENGPRMIGDNSGKRGLTLEGTEGELTVDVHGCKLTAEPASLLDGYDLKRINAYDVHRQGWIDAVRGGPPVLAPAMAGHRTATACHLNNLAMRVGRGFRWDPVAELSDDDEVNSLLIPLMREPWTLG